MFLFIAEEHLAAFHDHAASVFTCMREFPFPISFLFEVRNDSGTADGKVCLEQGMGDTALRFLGCPAIEFFGSLVPGDHSTCGIAHENSIAREINEFGLQTNVL